MVNAQSVALAQRDGPDIDDVGYVKNWTALGDSYASGIGAGTVLNSPGDVTCSRYSNASSQILRNKIFTQNEYHFLACTGANSDDVQGQIQQLSDTSLDLAVLSVGGNDVNFGNALRSCVYFPSSEDVCNQALQQTSNLIQNNLYNAVSGVLSKLDSKMRTGAIVVTSLYAEFWNAATDICNNQTWTWIDPVGKSGLLLTQDRRTKMNEFVVATNKIIKNAVNSMNNGTSKARYVYADYNYYIGWSGGRFCELNETGTPTDTINQEMFQREDPALYAHIGDNKVKRADPRLVDSLYRYFHLNVQGQTIAAASIYDAIREQHARDISYDLDPPMCDPPGIDSDADGVLHCNGGAGATTPWLEVGAAGNYAKQFCGSIPLSDGFDNDLPSHTERLITFGQGSDNEADYIIHWNKQGMITLDECNSFLAQVINGCDVPQTDPAAPIVNPANLKYGGSFDMPNNLGFVRVVPKVQMHRTLECFPTTNNTYGSLYLYTNIGDFCSITYPELVQNVTTYNLGTADETAMKIQTPQTMNLSPEDCHSGMQWMLDQCYNDGFYNGAQGMTFWWKHGATLSQNGVQLTIAPQHTRLLPSYTAAVAQVKAPWKVLYLPVTVKGGGWASWDSGSMQGGLKTQLGGCGGFRGYNFKYFDAPDENGYEWQITATTIVGQKGCLKRAVKSAGGPKV